MDRFRGKITTLQEFIMRDISPTMKGVCDTLMCMVTCSREYSRFSLLKETVESLKTDPDWENWSDHFFVFDNDSTYEGSRELILSHFDNVFLSKKNHGYWTAVKWLCDFAVKKGYKFIYLIESDCPHYDIGNLRYAREILDLDDSVGMVRTSKFSIKEKHLYDKRNRVENSNVADWFVQYNMFTNQSATFEETNVPLVWKTNLVGKVVGLHRVSHLNSALNKILGQDFSEIDFQRSFNDLFASNAILDGGIYDSAPSLRLASVAGSYISENNPAGYIPTRSGFILPPDEVELHQLSLSNLKDV